MVGNGTAVGARMTGSNGNDYQFNDDDAKNESQKANAPMTDEHDGPSVARHRIFSTEGFHVKLKRSSITDGRQTQRSST